MALALVCVGAFAASWWMGRGLDVLTLVCCGAKDRELMVGAGEWWRLVSAGFLHGHVLHLGANVFALIVLGPLVERLWGTMRFLLIYLVALAAGTLVSVAATPGVSVGASGAICGLFGALVVFATVHRRFVAPHRRLRLWISLAIVAAIEVLIGRVVPFVDEAGHAGGFAGGALFALLLRPFPARRGQRPVADLGARLLCGAAVAVAVGSLARAVEYALDSDWILLSRSAMETPMVSGGEFSLRVPKGWTYQEPDARHKWHVFVRPGVAAVSVRLLPRREAADTTQVAQSVEAQWAKWGGELLARRNITIGGKAAIELLLRQKRDGQLQRVREVVFSAWSGRVFCASCTCAERRYPLLEIVFDKVLHSIHERPPRPAGEGAQSVWQRFVEDPTDAEACVLLASSYAREGRHAAAEQLLKVAIGLRPRYAEAHNELARLYADRQSPCSDPQKALHHAREALAARPDTPSYLATLALAHEAAGERREAIEAARRAVALAPDDAGYADLLKRLMREE